MSRFSANTNAHHLHDILERVRNSGKQRVRDGWAIALEAPFGDADFVRMHSEVANLLSATCRDVDALGGRQSDRVSQYFPAWWSAVVYPNGSWIGDVGCQNLISEQALDMLAVTADLIAGALAGSSAAPRGGDLSDLREKCEEWLTLLEEIPSGSISDGTRDQLSVQVAHLIWLIDNVNLFGGARVAQQTEGLVGSLTQAVGGLPNASPLRGKLGAAVVTLMSVLFVFNQGTEIAQTSIENAKGVVREITQTYEGLTD
ncbi:hypothetical protein ACFUCQ_08595 [Streptomyces sp. NPDC057197]|uniref:hypothetical protein n=1 Tax=Streptomyces sp. NPDC057197 TaxID=3346045 RepID=UPI003638574E